MSEFPDIPGYRIQQELGHGGMATVYLAVQESLAREVALKIMATALAADRSFTDRFLKEARTAARLQHPGIVAIHDMGVAGHYHYIAMEHVAGGELKDRLRAGAMPSEKAARIVHQIADALAYAHEKGFVHRDVKPENILFRENGQAVLTDFGIARAMGTGTRMTATGLSIGTPHYMSPEQARGKEIDGRSDLYALGIVFYEMLTGQVPFEAQDSFAVGLMHINDTPPPLPANLSRFQPVIDKLLAKDPAERYQSGSELSADLDRLGQGESIRPRRRSTRMAKRISRSDSGQDPVPSGATSRWTWALGGGALALVLAVGIYLWQDASSPMSPVGGGATVSRPASPTNSASQPTATATETRDPKPVPAGNAILHIETTPERAEVFLDDNQIGTTPFQSEDLPAGEHRLRLTHRYYEPWEQTVRLEDDVVERIEADPQRGQGRVTIITDPPGAEVWLDGSPREDVTPVTISGLSAGDQSLEIRLDRHRTVARTVEILPGEAARLDLKLEGGDLYEWEGRWLTREEILPLVLQSAEADLTKMQVEVPAFTLLSGSEIENSSNPAVTQSMEMANAALERGEFEAAAAFVDQAEAAGVAPRNLIALYYRSIVSESVLQRFSFNANTRVVDYLVKLLTAAEDRRVKNYLGNLTEKFFLSSLARRFRSYGVPIWESELDNDAIEFLVIFFLRQTQKRELLLAMESAQNHEERVRSLFAMYSAVFEANQYPVELLREQASSSDKAADISKLRSQQQAGEIVEGEIVQVDPSLDFAVADFFSRRVLDDVGHQMFVQGQSQELVEFRVVVPNGSRPMIIPVESEKALGKVSVGDRVFLP